MKIVITCTFAYPESFVRVGWSNLKTFFSVFFRGERGSKQIPLKTGHHRPASELPFKCRYCPKIECWLDRFVIFQAIRTSVAKKHYIFVIFQEGPDPMSPSGSGWCLCYLFMV